MPPFTAKTKNDLQLLLVLLGLLASIVFDLPFCPSRFLSLSHVPQNIENNLAPIKTRDGELLLSTLDGLPLFRGGAVEKIKVSMHSNLNVRALFTAS